MRIYVSIFLIFLAVCSVSCTTSTNKQPIPDRPLIGGQILDLPNDVAVTIRVHTLTEREVRRREQLGPGSWEVVITEAGGVDYVVTAEAGGYISQPISYTIHISGDTAYVVCDGEVTDEEALHLDFDFVSEHSP
ncbi:MAG TPA: hypothetical protein PLN71_05780 [Anaerolineae bacterium]|nr:hypothetical protein [Anaerolineae bacterium]